MFLVELVMQGVRGIREVARLRFRSGFNLVAAGNEAGKTTAVDAALRLLFPNDRAGLADPLVSKQTPDASRAALVAYSDDGAYYRVIRDFSRRAVNLSKYNPTTKDFALMSKDWDSAGQFMAGLTAGISEDEFTRLFVVRREQYPGNSGTQIPRTAAPARPAAPRPAAVTAGQEARLAELREALRKSEEAADADYRFQSAKLGLEEIRKKRDAAGDMARQAGEIEASLEALKGCETLPPNLNELLEQHEQRQAEKMAKSDELTRDIGELNLQFEAMPQPNTMKDPFFLLGVVVAIVSVVAGLFVLTEEHSQYFPLGILLAAGLIVTAWYKGSRKNTERKAVLKEVEHLQAELDELEKSFEVGGADIAACMNATGSATVAELKDKADNYRYFLTQREDIAEQQRQRFGETGPADLQTEYEKRQREVEELERAAAAVSGNAIDTYALRQDIERLEAEMSGAAGAGLGSGDQELSADFALSVPASGDNGAGFVTELGIASRVGGIEIETLVPAVEAAAQRNLASVTAGKYVRIEAGHEGDPVVHAKDGSLVNFPELSRGTRELVYFCLRTGLIEALSGKLRLPFMLDDPLAGFDPGRQQAACQILRSLGTRTQVLLFTSNAALKAAGDATAELK